MSDDSKINWKKVAQTFLLCCGKCKLHSKCSNCCEVELEPELTPQVSKNSIKDKKETTKEDLV